MGGNNIVKGFALSMGILLAVQANAGSDSAVKAAKANLEKAIVDITQARYELMSDNDVKDARSELKSSRNRLNTAQKKMKTTDPQIEEAKAVIQEIYAFLGQVIKKTAILDLDKKLEFEQKFLDIKNDIWFSALFEQVHEEFEYILIGNTHKYQIGDSDSDNEKQNINLPVKTLISGIKIVADKAPVKVEKIIVHYLLYANNNPLEIIETLEPGNDTDLIKDGGVREFNLKKDDEIYRLDNNAFVTQITIEARTPFKYPHKGGFKLSKKKGLLQTYVTLN